jgi:hypothetical protein
VSDDVALADIFTLQVVGRLQSLETKTEAQLTRVSVLTCGDGTGRGMIGPDLVTFRDAWARYLACAFRVGLFDGVNGNELRARLTGTDDDNFISAMNECLATWFLADHLGLSVTPRPSGKSRSILELAITLPDGQIFVEVKGLIRPIYRGPNERGPQHPRTRARNRAADAPISVPVVDRGSQRAPRQCLYRHQSSSYRPRRRPRRARLLTLPEAFSRHALEIGSGSRRQAAC